jgi:hypothetical protein
MNVTVSLPCESTAEANLIRNAVNRYRHVLKDQGVDPRDFAPPSDEGAGFGWDAVQRTAGDMSAGSVTHMSPRMARAIHLALQDKAAWTRDPDAQRIAAVLMSRINRLIIPPKDGWVCPYMPFGHAWTGDTVCRLCGETRTVSEVITSLLAGLPGFSEERAAALVARHVAEATA